MPIRNLAGGLYLISKGSKHLLTFTDIEGTFTVPIMNHIGHLYEISKGKKHLLSFTDI